MGSLWEFGWKITTQVNTKVDPKWQFDGHLYPTGLWQAHLESRKVFQGCSILWVNKNWPFWHMCGSHVCCTFVQFGGLTLEWMYIICLRNMRQTSCLINVKVLIWKFDVLDILKILLLRYITCYYAWLNRVALMETNLIPLTYLHFRTVDLNKSVGWRTA